MDQFSFTEICPHQLKMSGVHEGEKLIVLTQGNERLDYADAFMAAGMRLGAKMYHMRLPPVPPAGAWAVGQTGLAAHAGCGRGPEGRRHADRLHLPALQPGADGDPGGRRVS